MRLPAGESCAGRACWASSASGRLRYRDADASPDGVRQLQLTPGPEGAAKIKLGGGGYLLAISGLPLTPPVRVELRRASGSACWGATYTTPLRNDGGGFKARSD